MVPREKPCLGYSYDESNPEDPWHSNRPITANFNGFTGWKNNRNGAIVEKAGDVRLNNFKAADNKLAGIEFSRTDWGNDMARVDNALVIGRSRGNADDVLMRATVRGIISPRTDHFLIENTRFFNFDWRNSAAFGSCSHCWHDHATDSGARNIRLRNITLDESVTRVFNLGTPYRAIFQDMDGSVTGKGPNSYITHYYAHLDQPECEYDKDYLGMVSCDNTV